MKAPFFNVTREENQFSEKLDGEQLPRPIQFPRNSSIVVRQKVQDESTTFSFVYAFNDNRNYTT